MHALESLTETQVNDFLSGRLPLTLALRVGDHMMFVQLQLSPQDTAGQQQRPLNSRSTGRAEQGGCSVAGPPTSRKPGSGEPSAVIESLVSHAPGVFSGTFSGTLPRACQDSSRSSRRGVNTILQILNDLLSATRHHQGAPMSPSQLRCPTPTTPTCSAPTTPTSPSPPLSPLVPDVNATPETLLEHINQGQSSSSQTSGLRPSQSENQVLRCKLERLQILLHQNVCAGGHAETLAPHTPTHLTIVSPGPPDHARPVPGTIATTACQAARALP